MSRDFTPCGMTRDFTFFDFHIQQVDSVEWTKLTAYKVFSLYTTSTKHKWTFIPTKA